MALTRYRGAYGFGTSGLPVPLGNNLLLDTVPQSTHATLTN